MFTVFKKIKKRIFFTIIMILVFFSVYNLVRMNIKSSSQEISVKNSNLALKLDNMKADIVNKKLLNIKNILPSGFPYNYKIIFLYSMYDCNKCVQKGFYLCKKINNIYNEEVVSVVSIYSDVGADQLKYNYKSYIYMDKHDDLRRELKYVLTPILLLINKKYKILDCYFPQVNTDSLKLTNFLNSVDKYVHL